MLYDIVRKMPDGAQVHAELLTNEGGRLQVAAGSVRFELACLPKEDFPQMATGALPHKFRLAADEAKNIIDKTRFAISTEETRFYLNGIYVHALKEGKTKMLRAVGNRRPPAGPLRDGPAGRRRRHARRHHPAQDRERAAQAARRCRRWDRCRTV
jgi:hypothetical protein